MSEKVRLAEGLDVLIAKPISCTSVAPEDGSTITMASRRRSARFFTHLLTLSASEIPASSLGKRALVFSPHPDDECLGCGGIILKKKQAGATVKIVQMTDGGASHPHLISKQELKAIRTQECRNAAGVLGVDETFFLDFDDSALSDNLAAATDRVGEILLKEQPEEVFVPHRREPTRQAADHNATTQIVMAALRSYPREVTVWEYPVWFWLHWPWVGFNQEGEPSIKPRHIARNSVQLLGGLRAFTDLTSSVNISEVLPKKIAALAEHRSQMSQYIPDQTWTTLAHVSKGQFLECFYLDREFFRRSTYRDSHASNPVHL